MTVVNGAEDFVPPSYPPPLLTDEEIAFLSLQGWLPVVLPERLKAQLQLVSAHAARFFETDAAKKRALYPPRNGTECGYYVVPEEKEYITFRHQQHSDSELEQHVREAWKLAANLLHRVLCDLSRAHHCNPAVWKSIINDCLELPRNDNDIDTNISLMRVFQYYPEGLAEQHTDVGLATLCVGEGRGLEMVDHSRETKRWVSARVPIILVGATASALMNGKVRAGIHRVVKNPDGRGSIVYALRPCLTGKIDLKDFNGEGIVDVKDYFYEVKSDKYNVNATVDLREKQRKEQEQRRKRRELNALQISEPQPRMVESGVRAIHL